MTRTQAARDRERLTKVRAARRRIARTPARDQRIDEDLRAMSDGLAKAYAKATGKVVDDDDHDKP